MSTYRLFPSTNGPSAANSYGGSFLAGVAFTVTQPTMYLSGYYWWVCNSGGQPTSAQPFALWNLGINNAAKLVTTGTVTSGALTAGAWNYVALSTPIPLSENQIYLAATAFTGSFPETVNQFGSGDPYAAGITNGPLFAYSDTSGSAPAPLSGLNQSLFGTGSTDPTTAYPGEGSNSANFWMDMQLTDVGPSNPTYRVFPSMPSPILAGGGVSGGYTLTSEFTLSGSCTVEKLWFYSGSGCAILPSRCGIFGVSSQTEVSGSDNSSPSWLSSPGNAAAAGGGWCYVDYSTANLTLPAGNYHVAVYSAGASGWFSYSTNYWASSFVGTGVGNGPITAPGSAEASSPGQGGVLNGSWGYPTSANGNNFWVDIEVAVANAVPVPKLTMVSIV